MPLYFNNKLIPEINNPIYYKGTLLTKVYYNNVPVWTKITCRCDVNCICDSDWYSDECDDCDEHVCSSDCTQDDGCPWDCCDYDCDCHSDNCGHCDCDLVCRCDRNAPCYREMY